MHRRGARRIGVPHAPPTAWQCWLQDHVRPAGQPLVRAHERLVVLAPHPDDEVLACALLMQQHAARGGALHILGATDGEASHGEEGALVQQLQQARCAERREGLARLGLGQVPVTPLHLPDGGVSGAGARLHALLMQFLRPGDVLLTTWRLDGPPDHECCGRVACDVARRLGLRLLQAPVWMWHWAEPGCARIDWPALRSIGAPRQAVEAKAWALQAHRSQLLPRPGGRPPVLDAAIVERAGWAREYFFL
ncbi:PIG-L deacetylase family protein [Melaminivora alkalimesophila]|nr:PIG-L family deacetylase [Melaminivora alkalimesophila]